MRHRARSNLEKSDRTKDSTCYTRKKESCQSQNKGWSETQTQIQLHDGEEGKKSVTKPIFSPPGIGNSVCMFSKSFQQQSVKMMAVCRWLFPVRPQKQDGWWPLSLWKPLNTHLALLIQQIENSHFGLYEVDARLIVVEINQGPWYLFLHIFFLFQLKDMLQGKKKTVFCEIKCRINTSNSHLNPSWHIIQAVKWHTSS